MKLLPCLFLLLACGIVLPSRTQRSSAEEVENELEFNYVKGSELGPEKWGDLKDEWSACKKGELQSPVDLTSKRVQLTPGLGRLQRKYWACNATVKNRGHDIAIVWTGDAGWIKINNSEYKLLQSHWHSPSEHTINGKRYPLELHMVHQTADPKAKNKLAVVGMLYEIGRPDPFITRLMKNVTLTTNERSHEVQHVKEVDPNEIKAAAKTYYRYIGSLTVPPCTEGVIWTISQRVRTVSKEQLSFLREAVHDQAENNARPVQALNRRGIYYYIPGI